MAVAAAKRQSEGLGEERACVWQQARKRVGLRELEAKSQSRNPADQVSCSECSGKSRGEGQDGGVGVCGGEAGEREVMSAAPAYLDPATGWIWKHKSHDWATPSHCCLSRWSVTSTSPSPCQSQCWRMPYSDGPMIITGPSFPSPSSASVSFSSPSWRSKWKPVSTPRLVVLDRHFVLFPGASLRPGLLNFLPWQRRGVCIPYLRPVGSCYQGCRVVRQGTAWRHDATSSALCHFSLTTEIYCVVIGILSDRFRVFGILSERDRSELRRRMLGRDVGTSGLRKVGSEDRPGTTRSVAHVVARS